MNIKIKNRALSHVVGTVPRTVRKAARSGTAPYSLDARHSSLIAVLLSTIHHP